MAPDESVVHVWNQGKLPVIYVPYSGPLMIRLPKGVFTSTQEGEWLRLVERHRRKPQRNERFNCWDVPRAWYRDLSRQIVERFDKTYLIKPYRESQKCAPACWDAKGDLCVCSCMGKNHGLGQPGGQWFIVSDTCAVKWGEKDYSLSVLSRKPEVQKAAASALEDPPPHRG